MSTGTLIRTRRLPHWDVPGATYFVTSCLAGSIPACGLLDIAKYRDELERRECPTGTTNAEWECRAREVGIRGAWTGGSILNPLFDTLLTHDLRNLSSIHSCISRARGMNFLPTSLCRATSTGFFQPLGAWVESLGSSIEKRPPRERIMHTLKTHTALECNRLLGRSGTFWQDESFDHWVRDEDELYRIIGCVEHAIRSRLGWLPKRSKWLFSSRARLRLLHNIRYGETILKKHLE